MATEESRITHLAGIEEVDVLLPYLAAVLVLADMREGEFVCLLDCFARARIRIEASARDYDEMPAISERWPHVPNVYEVELPQVDRWRGPQEPPEQRFCDVERTRAEEVPEVRYLRAGL